MLKTWIMENECLSQYFSLHISQNFQNFQNFILQSSGDASEIFHKIFIQKSHKFDLVLGI